LGGPSWYCGAWGNQWRLNGFILGDLGRAFGAIETQDGYMGVSKNRDTPKWMVYNGNPHKNG